MTAEAFLAKLAQADLTPPEVVASLRRQVAAAKEPISATTVAKLLVDKHHLTPSQAQKLLAAPAAKTAAARTPAQGQPVAPAAKASVIDDLGLAPLEDLEPAAAPVSKPATQPAQKPAIQKPAAPTVPSVAELSPLDDLSPAGLDSLGDLQPLDSLSALDSNPLGSDPLGSDPLGSDPLGSDPLAVGGGLDSLGGADLGGAVAMQTATTARAQITPATMAAANAARESRTTKVVGLVVAGVALLVILIGLAVFLWPRGTGNAEFQAAEQAYQEKQFGAALEKYNQLLRVHPQHEQASLARVHRGLCQIQLAASASDWSKALPTIQSAATSIAAEPALSQAHPELAPLLLQMTEELAALAAAPKPGEQSEADLNQARAALALCDDARLLPAALRPWQQLAGIDERLQALAREAGRSRALEQARSQITVALNTGDLPSAFSARQRNLAEYPELAGDAFWSEIAPKFAAAAASAVKTTTDRRVAEREPRKTPAVVSLPWQLQNAQALDSPPAFGERAVLLSAAGAVHALDAESGAARWSHYLGCSANDQPLVSPDGKTAWLAHRTQPELLAVGTLTGKLLWRQPLASSIAGSPLLVAGKICVALRSGQLHCFDAASGELHATAQLPQLVNLGPIATGDGKLLQLAEEGLLYVLSAADLKCSAAIYLSHERGGVDLPPVIFQQQLVVAGRHGLSESELLVVELSGKTPPVKRQRLASRVVAPLQVAGKRLLVSSANGQVQLLEPKADGNEPFQLVQALPQVADQIAVRFLQVTPDGIAAAGQGLSLLKFDAAGKLQPGWTAFAADAFDSACAIHEQSLVSVRYAADQDALYAAAVNAADGQPLWSIPLQLPLVLLTASDETGRPLAVPATAVARLLATEAAGSPAAELKQLLSQPSGFSGSAAPIAGVISFGIEQLIVPPRGSQELLFLEPPGTVRKLKLPGQLAGAPAIRGTNLLVPLSDGAVVSVNPVTGQPTAEPFVGPPVSLAPLPVTVSAVDEAGNTAIVVDGLQSIVCLQRLAEPKPHWAEQATARLSHPLAAPPVVLSSTLVAVDRRGQLHCFALADLTPREPIDLKGSLIWGPHCAGEIALLGTDRDELWCIGNDGQPRWQQSLKNGPPVGEPLVQQSKLILLTADGWIEVRAAGSGDLIASSNLQQPLAGPAILSGNLLWLTTTAGQVLQVSIPTEQVPR